MENSQVRDFEKTLKHIKELGGSVDIHFDGGITITGPISYVGSDFVELEIRIPGGNRKAACPFWSIQYLQAVYEAPESKQPANDEPNSSDRVKDIR